MYDYLFKVVMIGNHGVGLSTLIKNYFRDFFSESYSFPLGVAFYLKEFSCNRETCKMQLWRIFTAERTNSLQSIYFQNTHAAVIVYDLTDPKSLRLVPEWIKLINAFNRDIPIILLGNKADLIHSRKIFQDDIDYLLDKFNIALYQEISALNETDIDDAFIKLIKMLLEDDAIDCYSIKSENSAPKPEQILEKNSVILPFSGEFKIILFGESSQNRTILMQRFFTNLFVSDSKATIGVDFDVKSIRVDGKTYKLQVWNFPGGEERFRFLLSTYFRGALGGIFVYDISDKSTFVSIDKWLGILRREIKTEKPFPIIMMGMMPDKLEKREVSIEEAINIAKARGLDGYIECNVRSGENVEEAFEALVNLMLQEREVNQFNSFIEELKYFDSKLNKEEKGDYKQCPNCGARAYSGQHYCKVCNHKFS